MIRDNRKELDLCSGPVIPQMLRYSLPLMVSGILQLLFNCADIAVVGNYSGSASMAAVGSNTSLIHLVISLFMGISVGANILVAQNWGARQWEGVSRSVHAAMALSVILGAAVGALGVIAAPAALKYMSVPDDVLPLAVIYLRIYFLGIPATIVYNFGAAVLRAIGDTRHPLYYLTAAGILNIGLNLILVCVFHLDVAGVGIASAVSQVVSAVLVLRCLCRKENASRLCFRKMKLHRYETERIIKLGIPAGLQRAVFSVSNVVIQSAINTFGADVISGNVAAWNVEELVSVGLDAIAQSGISFMGQNIGAGKAERLKKTAESACVLGLVLGLFLGTLVFLFPSAMVRFFNPDAAVIAAGVLRLRYIGFPMILCGIQNICGSLTQGMGRAWLPMAISMTGSCLLRVLWVWTVFAANPTPVCLYLCYPLSWAVMTVAQGSCMLAVLRKTISRIQRGDIVV